MEVRVGGIVTTTRSDGWFVARVQPGAYGVSVAEVGFLPASASGASVTAGQPVDLGAVVLLSGDVDGDGDVDTDDLTTVAGGTADLNGDGASDVLDLVHVGRNFGKTESHWPGAP